MEAVKQVGTTLAPQTASLLKDPKSETVSKLSLVIPATRAPGFFERTLVSLKERIYGPQESSSSQDIPVTPEELIPLLDEHHIGSPSKSKRKQIALYLCREINAMALDRENNKGKIKYIEGDKIAHLFPQFDKDGNLLPDAQELKIPFKIWMQMNSEGTKVKLLMVPIKDKESLIGKGGFKAIYRAKEVEVSLSKAHAKREVGFTPYVVQLFRNPKNSSLNEYVDRGFKTHESLKEMFPESNITETSSDISTPESHAMKMRWYHGDFRNAALDGRIPLDIDGVKKRYFEMDDSLKVVVDAAQAMEKIHRVALVHLDLKPENILIDVTKKGEVVGKVSDFDLITSMKKKDIPPAPAWWVDRLTEKGWVTSFVDVYSLAISLSNTTIPFFHTLQNSILYEFMYEPEENKEFCLKQMVNSIVLKAAVDPIDQLKDIKAVVDCIHRDSKLLTVDMIMVRLNKALQDPKITLEGRVALEKLIADIDQRCNDFYKVTEAYENNLPIDPSLRHLVRPLDKMTIQDIYQFRDKPFLMLPYDNLGAIRERILTLAVGDALLLKIRGLEEEERSEALNTLLRRVDASDPTLTTKIIIDEVNKISSCWLDTAESVTLKDIASDLETICSVYRFTASVYDQGNRLHEFFEGSSTARDILDSDDDQKKISLMDRISTDLGIFNMYDIKSFAQSLIKKRKNQMQRNSIDTALKTASTVLAVGCIAVIVNKALFKL